MPDPETPQSAQADPSPVRRRMLIGGAAAFVLYLIAGYVVVPRLVEDAITEQVEAQTGVRPTMDGVSFDPFGWRLAVEAFALPDPSGGDPVVAFGALAADLNVPKLLLARIALEEVVWVEPRISLVIDEGGVLNISRLLPADDTPPDAEPEPEPEADEGLPAVEIASIRIEGGEVDFVDRSQSPAFELHVEPLDLEIEGLTTRAGERSPYDLVVRIGEETELRWQGTLGLDPIHSEGEVELTGFDLRVPWDFMSERLRFDVGSGALDASTRYVVDVAKDSVGFEASVTGAAIAIRDVDLKRTTDASSFLEMPSVVISGIEAQLTEAGLAKLTIADVLVDRASLDTFLAKDGSLEIASLFTTIPVSEDGVSDAPPDAQESKPSEFPPEESVEPTTAPPAETAPAPSIRVDQLRGTDLAIAFEDRGPGRPVPIRLSSLNLVARGYSNDPGSAIDLELDTGVGDGGKLAITGPLVVSPLSTRLAIEATAIGLGDFQPYLEGVAKLDVPSGDLTTSLVVDVKARADDAGVEVGATGRVQLDDLRTLDRRLERRFVEWKTLRVEGLDYRQDAVAIEEIGLDGVLAHVALDRSGRSNLDAIFASDESSAKQASASSGEGESTSDPLRIDVGRIVLDGVGADFDDFTEDPPFSITLGDLAGSIEGLSSAAGARAKVDLEGRVDDTAPVRIAGQINPLSSDAYTDISIEVEGVSLPAFTPYSGRYVGYEIDRGKLALDLDYKLKARHLEAKNLVRLDQFAFGDRVESQDATSLPVPLAVAVLRDPSGRIEIPLPIEGDLDDPSFNLFGLLGKTLVNLVTRVATSPFSAVAGIVGATAQDLEHVAFDSGASTLREGESAELASVVGLLVDRPKLRLEIRGRADPSVDESGLRRVRIESEVRQSAFQALSRRERERLGDASNLELEPAERLAGLRALLRDRLDLRPRDLVAPEALPASGDARTEVLSEAAVTALAERVVLEETDWRDLARERAAAIQAAAIATGEISAERIYLVDIEVGPVGEGEEVASELSLRVD